MTTFEPGSVCIGFLDNGTWSACFGLSYRDLTLYDMLKSRRVVRKGGRELRAVSGSGNLPDSRNDVVKGFLDTTDGEWLFFVDTDMAFDRDTVDRLVASADPTDRPVMGALCFAARRGPAISTYMDQYLVHPTIYLKQEGVGYRPSVYPLDSVVPADGTGAAAILIHRSVLETMREKYGNHWFSRLPTEDGDGFYSEDLSFCIRLAELGVPLFVNTAVKTAHHKGLLYLEEDMWLANEGLTREGVSAGELPRPVHQS